MTTPPPKKTKTLFPLQQYSLLISANLYTPLHPSASKHPTTGSQQQLTGEVAHFEDKFRNEEQSHGRHRKRGKWRQHTWMSDHVCTHTPMFPQTFGTWGGGITCDKTNIRGVTRACESLGEKELREEQRRELSSLVILFCSKCRSPVMWCES